MHKSLNSRIDLRSMRVSLHYFMAEALGLQMPLEIELPHSIVYSQTDISSQMASSGTAGSGAYYISANTSVSGSTGAYVDLSNAYIYWTVKSNLNRSLECTIFGYRLNFYPSAASGSYSSSIAEALMAQNYPTLIMPTNWPQTISAMHGGSSTVSNGSTLSVSFTGVYLYTMSHIS